MFSNSRTRWFERYGQHRDTPRARRPDGPVPPRLFRVLNRIDFRFWTFTLAPAEADAGLDLRIFYGDPDEPSRLRMSRPIPVEPEISAAELVELVRAAVEEVAGPGAGAELVYRPERSPR